MTMIFSGCTTWQPLPFRSAPLRAYGPLGPEAAAPALPEEYQHYYDYPAPDFSRAEVVLTEEHKNYVMRRVEIPLVMPEELMPEDLPAFKAEVEALAVTDRKTTDDMKLRYTNRIDFYVPKNIKPGEKRPVILISPILGGNMVVDRFARYYAGRGYLAALVHRKRTWWDEKKDMQQIEDYLRSSVIRLRQAVDWVSVQPEVDPRRIGAFGVSYGAILHVVLAAVEPRIRYHVLAMPAAPIPDVIMACPDKAITKLLTQAQEKNGLTLEQVYDQLQKTVRTDPKYLAPYVPRDRMLVYVAAFDRVVGARRSFGLWKALGKPKLRVMPFGHYGGVVVFPLLQTQSYLAFKRHLKVPRN